jgi:hypothetical protein
MLGLQELRSLQEKLLACGTGASRCSLLCLSWQHDSNAVLLLMISSNMISTTCCSSASLLLLLVLIEFRSLLGGASLVKCGEASPAAAAAAAAATLLLCSLVCVLRLIWPPGRFWRATGPPSKRHCCQAVWTCASATRCVKIACCTDTTV